jgi:hypothetical protein
MEATEMNEFSKEMKEGGEAGMRHISLAISVLAVLVAMVTVLGHRTHTEAVLTQTRAADQWNQLQAQKIRQTQDTSTVTLLVDQPNTNSAGVQKDITDLRAHIDKYKGEIKEEKEKALDLEHEVNLAERRADRYDLGEALLEIAVVLSSITLLTRQKGYFLFGLMVGVVGLLAAASALLIH